MSFWSRTQINDLIKDTFCTFPLIFHLKPVLSINQEALSLRFEARPSGQISAVFTILCRFVKSWAELVFHSKETVLCWWSGRRWHQDARDPVCVARPGHRVPSPQMFLLLPFCSAPEWSWRVWNRTWSRGAREFIIRWCSHGASEKSLLCVKEERAFLWPHGRTA